VFLKGLGWWMVDWGEGVCKGVFGVRRRVLDVLGGVGGGGYGVFWVGWCVG